MKKMFLLLIIIMIGCEHQPSPYKRGDIVVLKSGGPDMTVRMAWQREVSVQWIDYIGQPQCEMYHNDQVWLRLK